MRNSSFFRLLALLTAVTHLRLHSQSHSFPSNPRLFPSTLSFFAWDGEWISRGYKKKTIRKTINYSIGFLETCGWGECEKRKSEWTLETLEAVSLLMHHMCDCVTLKRRRETQHEKRPLWISSYFMCITPALGNLTTLGIIITALDTTIQWVHFLLLFTVSLLLFQEWLFVPSCLLVNWLLSNVLITVWFNDW